MPRTASRRGGKYGRKYGRAWKKSRSARKYYRRKSPAVNPSSRNGNRGTFPTNMNVLLRYCDVYNLTRSTTQWTQTYRANSVHDPYYATGGHQPMGFDQWAEFYSYYTVTSCKCTVRVAAGNNNNNSDASMLFIALTTGAIFGATDVSAITEQNMAVTTVIPGNPQIISGNDGFTLTKWFNARDFFRLQDVKDAKGLVGATTGSSPTSEAFFQIGLVPYNVGGTYGGQLNLTVELEYHVEFSDPISLQQS